MHMQILEFCHKDQKSPESIQRFEINKWKAPLPPVCLKPSVPPPVFAAIPPVFAPVPVRLRAHPMGAAAILSGPFFSVCRSEIS